VLNRLYRQYGRRVAFYVVYILEAHPSDLWQDVENVKADVVIADPQYANQRRTIASVCVRDLGLEMPAVVDGMDNAVERAYTAWPDRLYVIDRDGRVAFKSAAGPYGFHPGDAEGALRGLLRKSCQTP
jgi:hypothetical protein